MPQRPNRNGAVTLLHNVRLRLAEFILANVAPILQEWEEFARLLAPGAKMKVLALLVDAEAMLLAFARDMRSLQSGP